MADTTFVDHQTLIPAAWLNEVNRTQHSILGNPTNAAELVSNLSLVTTTALTTTSRSYSAQQGFACSTFTATAAGVTWDCSARQAAQLVLNTAGTLTATNHTSGHTYNICVTGTSSRALSYASNFKWPSGVAPTLSTASGAIDVLSFYCVGTNMLGVGQLNFS